MPNPNWSVVGRRAVVVGRRAVVVGLVVAVTAAALLDAALRVGPTRPATFEGKLTAAGFRYRVSYSYGAGGRRPSDTDGVTFPFFLGVHAGTPLRVRTVGWGTFRFARLAGGGTAAGDVAAVARWAAVGVALVVLVRRRRRVSAARTMGGPVPPAQGADPCSPSPPSPTSAT